MASLDPQHSGGGPLEGLLVVDKEPGWTSHDVVAKLRGILRTRKIGHAGTLDPDATGVLLVGVGRVTRLLRFLSALPKTYTGEIVLGVETSTLDASGEVTATHDMAVVDVDAARAAAAALTGDILQVPPMVSAVKVGGQRLHTLARRGIEVEREARPVTVHRFEVEPGPEPGVLAVEVECSSGTYVRTLAADLGRALGGGAHLRNLRRTAVGPFTAGRAHRVETVTIDHLLPPAAAVGHFDAITAEDDQVQAVGHGRVFAPGELGERGAGPWAVLDRSGSLVAVYEAAGGKVKPAVVLIG